jgi:hypothetical protein
MGESALALNLNGGYNVAIGTKALMSNVVSNNIAIGTESLSDNVNGSENIGIGNDALWRNISGSSNIANGTGALAQNLTGSNNTAIGSYTLVANNGSHNSATGALSLYNNANANYNSGFGYRAMFSNNNGNENSAFGAQALNSNVSGSYNTSTGVNSLYFSTGNYNTADGYVALYNNTGGSYNTALGYNTGPNAGGYVNTTCVGSDATATASNMVRIGNAFVTSINGNVNFTVVSDGRIKENIKENVPGLSFIKLLRPVTYRLNRDKINEMSGLNDRKKQITDSAKSKTDIPKFLTGDKYSDVTTGFIAQEVEASAKKLGFDFSGVDKPKNDKDFYGLRYAEFVVPLVKGMQEQQAIIEDQNKRIERLEKMVKELSDKLK